MEGGGGDIVEGGGGDIVEGGGEGGGDIVERGGGDIVKEGGVVVGAVWLPLHIAADVGPGDLVYVN